MVTAKYRTHSGNKGCDGNGQHEGEVKTIPVAKKKENVLHRLTSAAYF